jgi:hypothetical protein
MSTHPTPKSSPLAGPEQPRESFAEREAQPEIYPEEEPQR